MSRFTFRFLPLAAALYGEDLSASAAAAYDFAPFDGVHEFRGDLAWAFLRRWLR